MSNNQLTNSQGPKATDSKTETQNKEEEGTEGSKGGTGTGKAGSGSGGAKTQLHPAASLFLSLFDIKTTQGNQSSEKSELRRLPKNIPAIIEKLSFSSTLIIYKKPPRGFNIFSLDMLYASLFNQTLCRLYLTANQELIIKKQLKKEVALRAFNALLSKLTFTESFIVLQKINRKNLKKLNLATLDNIFSDPNAHAESFSSPDPKSISESGTENSFFNSFVRYLSNEILIPIILIPKKNNADMTDTAQRMEHLRKLKIINAFLVEEFERQYAEEIKAFSNDLEEPPLIFFPEKPKKETIVAKEPENNII